MAEGLAVTLPIETNEVFYNPAQVFNRDLSIIAISEYARGLDRNDDIRVFEGLAASGLRSIRYVKELHGARFEVTANDIEAIAVDRMKKNAEYNGLTVGESLFLTNEDAILHLHANKGKYDVIDLDPYGSCSIFVDAAVSSVRTNGLLCVTSTDGGVLCGNQPDMAFIRYGGFSLKRDYSHEMGLRVMLHSIMSAAARQKRGIRVLAALSIDFYFRVFVQVIEKPDMALESMLETGLVFQCTQCEFHHIQPFGRKEGPNRKCNRFPSEFTGKCLECESALSIGGPMYIGPLMESSFISSCLSVVDSQEKHELFPGVTSWAKIKALMHGLMSELPDVPLFYSLRSLAGSVKVSPPKLRVFKFYLEKLGFRVGASHRTPNVIKTDAPASVVFDLLRMYFMWTKPGCSDLPKLISKHLSTNIPEDLEIDWTIKVEDSRETPIYLPNPQRCWGPKQRAVASDGNSAKKLKLQAPPSTGAA